MMMKMKGIVLLVCMLLLCCVVSAQDNGTCNKIKDQTSCETEGCYYCVDKQKCRLTVSDCPGGSDSGGEGGGGNNGGGDGNGTDGEDGSTGGVSDGTCNPIKDQTECETAGCYFCTDKKKCRVSDAECPGGGGDDTDTDTDGDGSTGGVSNGTCNPIKDQTECETAGCYFCADQNKCRVSDSDCTGGGGNNGGGNGNGNNGGGNGNGNTGGGVSNGTCNPIKDATACTDAGCFFCEDKGLCRTTEAKCPGGGSGNAFGAGQCKPFKGDEDGCTNAGCFFCGGSSAQCRLDEAACPGQGRGNPCKSLAETDCSASEECLWCTEGSVCTTARGATCDTGLFVPPGNQCKQYTTDSECTDGETTNCRWCPDNSKCKNADDVCDDGGGGIKGNPCKNAMSTDGCTAIEGCLWCEDNSKCKKAEDGCDDEDDDATDGSGSGGGGSGIGGDGGDDEGEEEITCTYIFQPDCEAQSAVCQWCPDQAVCKFAGLECAAAAATVAVDIDYDSPTFSVRNSGLGQADANAVKVSLNYLFEVAEDSTEIPFSFVDVQNQGFQVAQTQGTYLGVKSRKATFATEIVGVGSVELIVYNILEDGIVSTDSGESFKVSEGDVKFNVNLSNWSFCDESTGICAGAGSAAFVDIAMTVKGSAASPEQDTNDGSIFNLGGGVPFILSNQVQVDGETDAMPPGFPRVEETDADGTFFVFRFPRFADTLVYDPIVGSGALKSEDGGATPAPGSTPTGAPGSPGASSSANAFAWMMPLLVGASLVGVSSLLC